MRVELIYTPGCRSYRKALHILEMVIAEERLPLPIELVENGIGPKTKPTLRIDGEDFALPGPKGAEKLRSAISQKWHEMTASPLLGG